MIKDQVIHCQHTQILITSCMVEGTASHQTEQRLSGSFKWKYQCLSLGIISFSAPLLYNIYLIPSRWISAAPSTIRTLT